MLELQWGVGHVRGKENYEVGAMVNGEHIDIECRQDLEDFSESAKESEKVLCIKWS